jgi:CHAD domain-containing protein
MKLPLIGVAPPRPVATVRLGMARPFAPDTAPDAALRQIVAACRADLLKHRATVLAGRRPTGIHQTRVALRRLRAALSLFRGAAELPEVERQMRALSAEAKWLAGECAPARDLHVFLTETVEEVPPLVRRIANRLMKAHFERARAALSGARFAALDRQLAEFAAASQQAPAGIGLQAFGRAVLDHRHARVEHRARKFGTLHGERLHRLRIAIKKLRYAATFLAPSFAKDRFAAKSAKTYIEATVRLQGALGSLNDRTVAAHVMADIAMAALPAEDVERALRKLAKQAASGAKRRRRRLQRAWKGFKQAERFWRDGADVILGEVKSLSEARRRKDPGVGPARGGTFGAARARA